jgi:hypothetical protein
MLIALSVLLPLLLGLLGVHVVPNSVVVSLPARAGVAPILRSHLQNRFPSDWFFSSSLHSFEIYSGTKDHAGRDDIDDRAAAIAIAVVDTQIAIPRLQRPFRLDFVAKKSRYLIIEM